MKPWWWRRKGPWRELLRIVWQTGFLIYHLEMAEAPLQHDHIRHSDLAELSAERTSAVGENRERQPKLFLKHGYFLGRIADPNTQDSHPAAQATALHELIKLIHVPRSGLADMAIHVEKVHDQNVCLNIVEGKSLDC